MDYLRFICLKLCLDVICNVVLCRAFTSQCWVVLTVPMLQVTVHQKLKLLCHR